ncbi:MAG: cyclic nucleotide-binding domain-containing protein [Sandaracinaceae bacterium]|nr:cyclic nucleotide-binding domain-containing protein [Sandaracinaceae bacterium]
MLSVMRIHSAGKTDVGRVRTVNEDAFLVEPALGLFVVCDGMGGHAAGDLASQTAISVIREHLAASEAKLQAIAKNPNAVQAVAEPLLREAIELASSKVFELGRSGRGKPGMGTTCSALLIVGGKAVIAHVGDSRIYLFRNGEIHQLTEDHTYTQEALRHGLMTPSEAKRSAHRNVLTRAVGPSERVVVDTLVFDVIDRDLFLLCSDGLYGSFEDPQEMLELFHTFQSNSSVDGFAQKLVSLACERGGHDNITALVVYLESVEIAQEHPAASERSNQINLDIETVRHIQLFCDFEMAELLRIRHISQQREYKEGEVIVREGDRSESLFLLISGEVCVHRNGQPIAMLGPGAHFGEMALLSNRPRSATVTARSHARLLVIERPALMALLAQDPVLATKFLWRLAQTLSTRLDDFYIAMDAQRNQNLNDTLLLGLYPLPRRE